jgi:hypothetical protein
MGSFTYYSFDAYIRWKDYPVVLGFDEQMADIFEIPFPAVNSRSFVQVPSVTSNFTIFHR